MVGDYTLFAPYAKTNQRDDFNSGNSDKISALNLETLFSFNGLGKEQGSPVLSSSKFLNPCHWRCLSTATEAVFPKHPRRQSSLLKAFSSTLVSFTNDGRTVADPSFPHSPFLSTLSPAMYPTFPNLGDRGSDHASSEQKGRISSGVP